MKRYTLSSALMLGALTVLFACSDPPGPGEPDPPRMPMSPAIVSQSVVRPAAGLGPAIAAGEAFVSMSPGTETDGKLAEITNFRTGVIATALMFNGGFDPVAVEAEAGDTLGVTVTHHAGTRVMGYGVVPIKSKPRVVRTSPPDRKTDVPLNPVIVVVFNQPMDSTSLIEAVRLRRGGIELAGSVTGEALGGVILRSNFAPAAPLEPQTTYQLSVSTAALSLDGEPLEEDFTAEFTTGGTGSERIVFASTRGGGTTADDLEIWSIGVDGSTPLRLTNNSVTDAEPAVNQGGSILFTRTPAGGPAELWLIEEDGSDPFHWPTDGAVASPVWSPESWLAWSERFGSSNVYDIKYFDWSIPDNRTVGSTDANRTTRRFSPAWRSDGQRLIFATDSSINMIRPIGTDEVMLLRVAGVSHLDRAPRTNRIVFNAPAVPDASQLGLFGTGAWIMNENGSGLVQVMTTTANSSWNSPRWDRTGTRLVFSRVVEGSPDSKIWIADADGSNAVEVAGVGNMNIHPTWP